MATVINVSCANIDMQTAADARKFANSHLSCELNLNLNSDADTGVITFDLRYDVKRWSADVSGCGDGKGCQS